MIPSDTYHSMVPLAQMLRSLSRSLSSTNEVQAIQLHIPVLVILSYCQAMTRKALVATQLDS